MTISNILVPIDGSDPSRNALAAGVYMAQIHKAKLHVLSVADMSEAAYPVRGVTLDVNGFSNVKDKAQKVLNRFKADVPAGVDAVYETDSGIPGEVITDYVEQEHIDMVVMGNSGKGAISSFIMGSVSQYVIHHVKCPVLVVK